MISKSEAMALIAAAGLAASANGQVIITEFFAATNQGDGPSGNERSQEFVEITNIGSTDVDISGWTLQDDVTTQAFPMGTMLLAGQSVVLYGTASAVPDPAGGSGDVVNPATFAAQWPGGAGINSLFLTPFESLSNSPNAVDNEVLQIVDAGGTVVDEVNYDDFFPWPSDSPQGSSMVLLPEFADTALLSLIGQTPESANDNGLAWRRADQVFQGSLKTDGGILSNEVFISLDDLANGVITIVPPSAPDANELTPPTNFASPGFFDFTPDVNDLNGNGLDDELDFFTGTSVDTNGNGIPDESEVDCNNNGIADDLEFNADLDLNGNPDFCDINDNGGTDGVGGTLDTNGDGIIDGTEVADVIITEIMFNPAGPENEGEYVEVYNAGDVAVDLQGWGLIELEAGGDLLGREDVTDGITESLVLQPGEVAVIINDYNDIGSRNGSSPLANVEGAFDDDDNPLTDPVAEFRLGWGLDASVKIAAVGDWGFRANNASPGDEILALYAPASGVITDPSLNDIGIVVADVVDYDADLTPFPNNPGLQWPGDTGTWSYQLAPNALDEVSNDIGGNWFGVIDGLNGGRSTTGLSLTHSSVRTEGSPRFIPATLDADGSGEVVISEIYAAPNTIGTIDTGIEDPDNPGTNFQATWQNEWVEIYNTTGAPIDLSGWYLRDEDGFSEAIPAGTSVAPGEAVVLFGIDNRQTFEGTAVLTEFPSAVAAAQAFYDAWDCGYQVIPLRGWNNSDFDAFGPNSNSLNNLSNGPSPANEVLRLYKADGTLVDVVNFEDADGVFEGTDWPNDPTGEPNAANFSIFAAGSALDAAANNLGGNWIPTIVGVDAEARFNNVTDFFTIDTVLVTTLMEGSPGIVPGGTPLDLDDCPTFSCNAADVAEPFGVLDLTDIDAFILAFNTGGTLADIAEPFGVLDLSDIDGFILEFFAGCP